MAVYKAILRAPQVASAIRLDLSKTKGENIKAIEDFLSQFQIKLERCGWVAHQDYYDHSPMTENDILMMDIRGYPFSFTTHSVLVRSPLLNSLKMLTSQQFEEEYEVIQDV